LLFLLKGLDILGEIVDAECNDCIITLNAAEHVSPHRHFPRTVGRNLPITLDDVGDSERGELTATPLGQQCQIRRLVFEGWCGGAVPLSIETMADGAVRTIHRYP